MSKINLVLSPSQQTSNLCKMGDTENVHCRIIAGRIRESLEPLDLFNICVVPQFDGKSDIDRLARAVNHSNSFIAQYGGTGYHVGIHSDAGGGRGCSGLYVTDAGQKLASSIIAPLMKLTPWNDVGLRLRTGLMELNRTTAAACIIEISFHDDLTQAKFIHSTVSAIADCFVDGILDALARIPDIRFRQAIDEIDRIIYAVYNPTKGVN